MSILAMTYSELGRHADALAMGEQVLDLWRRVLPANHSDIGEGCALRDGLHALLRLRGAWFLLFDFDVQARP
jgi:hypothetical protein